MRLHLLLLRGLDFVRRSQLPTGEIPSYCRLGGESLYCQSPLATSLAHDALACLDPFSPRFEREAAGRLPYPGGRWLAAVGAHVRRCGRDFVAWQERPDARFSFLGRGSALPPDAATTACCAAVLLEGRPPARRRGAPASEGWRRHARALARHRAPDGRFFTYVDAGGRGWASLGSRGERAGDFDRVVNAHALRFLALAGEPAGDLPAWLLAEAKRGDLTEGSPDHPDPLAFAHAAARAFAPLPERDGLARSLAPRVLALQRAGGSFGGSLATALALHALLDMGVEDAALAAAGRALADQAGRDGSWRGEAYVRQGGGSASLSTALAVSALLRLVGVFGPELAA